MNQNDDLQKDINSQTNGNDNKEGEKDNLKSTGEDLGLASLRTYESDVKRAVEKDNVSTAKIVLAEQKKREKQKDSYPKNKKSGKKYIGKF